MGIEGDPHAFVAISFVESALKQSVAEWAQGKPEGWEKVSVEQMIMSRRLLSGGAPPSRAIVRVNFETTADCAENASRMVDRLEQRNTSEIETTLEQNLEANGINAGSITVPGPITANIASTVTPKDNSLAVGLGVGLGVGVPTVLGLGLGLGLGLPQGQPDTTPSPVDASCSAYPQCAEAALEGICCPTTLGQYLVCCETVQGIEVLDQTLEDSEPFGITTSSRVPVLGCGTVLLLMGSVLVLRRRNNAIYANTALLQEEGEE